MIFILLLLSICLIVSGNPSVSEITKQNENETCWETNDVYEKNCFHFDTITGKFPTFPLTSEMLDRSIKYNTTETSIDHSFRIAREKGEIKIAVLGGSVTQGHGCFIGNSSFGSLSVKSCSWPSRVNHWFDENVKDFSVEIVNYAQGGTCILDLMHHVEEKLPIDMDVDIVIIGYGVNDGFSHSKDLQFAHEALIIHIIDKMKNKPSIIYFEDFVAPAKAIYLNPDVNMANLDAEVTKKYDIPMVSFRDAVWPNEEYYSFADKIWGPETHPDWITHQLMADVMVYYLQKTYARFLREHGTLSNPTPKESNYLSFVDKQGCLFKHKQLEIETYEFIGASSPSEFVESVGWMFSLDPGDPRNLVSKGGLIGYGNDTSSPSISTFDIPVKCSTMELGYFKSYTAIGALKVTIVGVGEYTDEISEEVVTIIDGLWANPKIGISVADYKIIQLPYGFESFRVRFEILSVETEKQYNLKPDPRREDRKFKIVSMGFC